ncbi:MAG: hypothetical protein ABIO83_09785 [Ilumatobacteraceae bacterium]
MADQRSTTLPAVVHVPGWFQGPTGMGQGGWTAHRFARLVDGPVSIGLTAPVPLDVDLHVVHQPLPHEPGAERWTLVHHTDDGPVTVMTATPRDSGFPDTEAVDVDRARAASARFDALVDVHPVPYCFSCGLQHDSMGVHAGPLPDGRFATDWRVPEWAITSDGVVDEGVMWAAIDCCAAWYVGYSRAPRRAVTAQLAVEVSAPLRPDTTYALVAWSGGQATTGWDGRKRHAASAAFDPDGACVARSVSFWIALDA